MKPKTKSMCFQSEIKAFNDKDLTIEHFISTEERDRSKDVVRADGVTFDGVPAVLKQHGQDAIQGNEPIAKPLSIKVGTNSKGIKGIIAKTQYYDGSHLTPPDNTGRRLYEKAKDGFMPYWSIRFRGIEVSPFPDGGDDIKKCVVYEYSQVGVPDNVTADVIKDLDGEEVEKKADSMFSFNFEKENKTGDLSGLADDDSPQYNFKSVALPIPMEIVKALNMDTDSKAIEIIRFLDQDVKYFKTIGESPAFFFVIPENDTEIRKEVERVADELKVPVMDTLKSIAERVATEIPYDAMSALKWAFMDELYNADGSSKSTKAIVEEYASLLMPYAMAFNAATVAPNEDMIKYQLTIDEHLSGETEDSVDPAPEADTDTVKDNVKPPADNVVLKLKKAPLPVSLTNEDKETIAKMIRSGFKDEVGKLLGRVS